MVLATTAFCFVIDPFIRLVALLVSSQISNLVLELLDHLRKDFYNSRVLQEMISVIWFLGGGVPGLHHDMTTGRFVFFF